MKKLYFFLTALAVTGAVNAQRNIDWEVNDILTPTALNSTLQGTPLNVSGVLKNNGPDNAQTGDSIFYQIILRNSMDQVILAAPAQGVYFRVLDKDVNNGDTIHLTAPNLNINGYVNFSQNVKLQLFSALANRGANGVAPETQATLTNNLFTKNIVWFNPQGWGVSVDEISKASLLQAGPNPAADQISLNWSVNASDENGTTLRMFDLSGRLVLEENASPFESGKALNVADLRNGFYMLEVSNAMMRQVIKVQVQH